MPDVSTQTDKPKRGPKKDKPKKIKEPKEPKEPYIKPKLLIIFDDDV